MQIVFNLPQLTSPDSSPAEVKQLRAILKVCIDGIRQAYVQSRIPASDVTLTDGRGGEVLLNLPHSFEIDEALNSRILRRMLDGLIACNCVYLKFHPQTPTLYRSGVVYDRTKVWESIPALYSVKPDGRKFGDCKSLTAAMVAILRMKGIAANPTFRWNRRDDGGLDYHILVQTNEGFHDPSKVLGMGADENVWFRR